MESAELSSVVVAEIEELHRCFEGIFAGDAAPLARVDAALAPSFSMVPPSGQVVPRASVIAGLTGAVGSGAMTIRIVNPRLLWSDGRSALAVYEEWQDSTDGTTARQSSVLFEVDAAAPGGLRWIWVHETWMPT